MNKIKKIGSLIVLTALVLVSANIVEASTFTIGTRGQAVADLQIKLIEAGFDIPAITKGGASTGYYGVQTQKAENAYDNQSSNGGGIVGSVTGPDSYFQCETHNGIQQCFTRKGLTQITPTGTTTPCAIQAPSATSTLVRATLQINQSTTTSGTWAIASSTTAYATTTVFDTFSVAGGAQYSYVYVGSTTPTQSLNQEARLMSPNSWLVFSVAGASQIGASNYGHIYGGICQATFQTL